MDSFGMAARNALMRRGSAEPLDAFEMPAFMRDHPGQTSLWECEAETIAVLGGAQSGKTIAGPWWMLREIAKCGPGEYAVGSPSYDLMTARLLPAYTDVLVRDLELGQLLRGSAPRIELPPRSMARLGWPGTRGATVLFRTLRRPDQWESMTCLAIHSDEAGQASVPEATFEAQERRLAVARSQNPPRGRHLMTTTPYTFNWFKQRIADRADGRSIALIRFPSWANPAFDRSVAEAALRRGMPPWRWKMMYEGEFTRPGGAVFDCWSTERHARPAPPYHPERDVVLGVDFGPVNMATVVIARDGSCWHAAATRMHGIASDRDHVRSMKGLAARSGRLIAAAGGSWSEDEWRQRMAAHGLAIARPPHRSIEARVACIYRLLREERLFIDPRLEHLIREIEEYQYVVDDEGLATDTIADASRFHRLDALGYALSTMEPLAGDAEDSGAYAFV